MKKVIHGLNISLPSWCRWITTDKQGEVWCWEYKPVHAHGQWRPVYSPPNYSCEREFLFKIDGPVLNWENLCQTIHSFPEPGFNCVE